MKKLILNNILILFSLDTETEGEVFQIFEGLDPGMAIRVNATSHIQIVLLPIPHLVQQPRFDVLIGVSNNTRSAIRINSQNEVVNVSTPNILQAGRWNNFRVVWANFMVLVFKDNDIFPFMVYNMESFIPIAHYGIRR
jgi:hypothetical protein